MGSLRRFCVVLLVALLVVGPSAMAQIVDPTVVGDTIRPVVEPVVTTVVPPTENESGQDLHGEDIRVSVALDVVNVDYQIIGILFGGGKVAADAICDLRLEFRGVSAERLDEAIRSASGEANASLNSTFGIPSNRVALTAEEVRLAGAGVLLAYFQEYEARKAQTLLQDTLPGLTVLDLALEWSNTVPAAYLRQAEPPGVPEFDPTSPYSIASTFGVPPLREPPLVLEGRARLNYLTRISLAEMLEPVLNGTEKSEEQLSNKDLKKRLQEEQGDEFLDRSAFNLLGFGQVLNASVPAGWRVDVSVTVPKGYTVEGATDELVVDGENRGANLSLDGLARTQSANPVGMATLSNRFLVTVVVLAAVLLAGYALRLPLEVAVLAIHQRLHHRAQKRLVKPKRKAVLAHSRANV